MFSRLGHFFRREKRVHRRSYEGAGNGRRWRGVNDLASAQAAALASRSTLARRSRALVANSAHGSAGVEAWTSGLVGTGIKFQARRPEISEEFENWTDGADADGLTDFYGLQTAITRSMVVNGEALAILQNDASVRLLDPEQLDATVTRTTDAGGRVVHGIEFDRTGKRVAYHIRTDAPGVPFFTSYTVERIPAADVLHVFRPVFPGQVRGLSWFAPVLLRAADYDRSVDAQLQRQLVAALFAGFIIDPQGQSSALFDGEEADQRGSILEGGLEPGTLKILEAGQDVRFSDPANIGPEAVEFLRITAREIATGLGLPYAVLTGDLSDSNYSSIRAGLIEWRRRIEAIQHGVIVFQFCRPVLQRWITARALRGAPDMADFFKGPNSYLAGNWITPRFDWVDPLKDTEAEVMAIEAGLMSRRQAVAARGYDLEALDREIAADRDRAKALGLDFSTRPAAQRKVETE